MQTEVTPPRFASWEEAVQWLRDRPEQRELVLAAYYDDPLPAAAERYRLSEEWTAIRALLPPARTQALDVGAGRGIASYALAHEGYRVTALEPDASALVGAEAIRSLAAHSGLPIEVTQEFSERLPYADCSFDLVFARAVLHHTRDLTAACKEFFRVLKPGGRLLAVREHVISRPADLDAFLKLHPLHHLYGGENAFLLEQYEAAICAAGFQIEQIYDPLESAVNFAPHTLESLQREVAAKASRGLPWIETAVSTALGWPGIWSMVRPLLARVDHRPGRLYSFVANRPC
ncbi:class I SAM-dependent methyltransferase [Hydrogenophaga crocea]|uniref:Class I SAM-dependent methyltransferase n=1 Tax=Hydrogenophaga crocea TaxID=2716225 RepID=A0A6G8ILW8_9BURK|nr:class I SAM-dependent methyltransferase [Hydrogenophaga crocea]QIM53980.1 class I SAM-dependent methyltransferase [Hydrogenophaga crocea]